MRPIQSRTEKVWYLFSGTGPHPLPTTRSVDPWGGWEGVRAGAELRFRLQGF